MDSHNLHEIRPPIAMIVKYSSRNYHGETIYRLSYAFTLNECLTIRECILIYARCNTYDIKNGNKNYFFL